jgi:hypothetical protein
MRTWLLPRPINRMLRSAQVKKANTHQVRPETKMEMQKGVVMVFCE